MTNVLTMTTQSAQSSSESGTSSGQSDTVTSSFELFWKAYPRKVGKLAARVIYRKILTDGRDVTIEGERIKLKATHEEIMAGLEAWVRTMRTPAGLNVEAKYIPHPSTWLNQGRWEDGL